MTEKDITADNSSKLVEEAKSFVNSLFREKLSEKYVFHDITHTLETMESCEEICQQYSLSDLDFEILMLAVAFHDTGYIEGPKKHEELSSRIVREFLSERNYLEENIQKVEKLIASTEYNQVPETPLEEILHDADMISMGKKRFFKRGELLRMEWEKVKNEKYSDIEWENIQLDFLLKNNFHTFYAVKKYSRRRNRNIQLQREKITQVKKSTVRTNTGKDMGRGIDTLYRAIYRNHINLSSIADGKANMMISINTIILSIIITLSGAGFSLSGVSVLAYNQFIIPIVILLLGSLISVTYAIISARPTVTGKHVDEEMIRSRSSSILYFGNFVKMKMTSFLSNLNLLKREEDLLYDNMGIDIYHLGLVLDKKYRLLKMSYNAFMFSLIISVISILVIYLYSMTSS